jgi:hypothetical protein
MAKRTCPISPDAQLPEVGLPEAPAAEQDKQNTVLVEIPLAPPRAVGYCPRRFHLEVHLGAREAETFRGIQTALDESHARLKSGKVVQSRADVCRWLFEQIAGGASQ